MGAQSILVVHEHQGDATTATAPGLRQCDTCQPLWLACRTIPSSLEWPVLMHGTNLQCRGLNPKSTLKGINALDSDQRLLSVSVFSLPRSSIESTEPGDQLPEPEMAFILAASSDARLTLLAFHAPTRRSALSLLSSAHMYMSQCLTLSAFSKGVPPLQAKRMTSLPVNSPAQEQ